MIRVCLSFTTSTGVKEGCVRLGLSFFCHSPYIGLLIREDFMNASIPGIYEYRCIYIIIYLVPGSYSICLFFLFCVAYVFFLCVRVRVHRMKPFTIDTDTYCTAVQKQNLLCL